MFNRKGFTLIELLIVVVIIGILAAIAIPKFAGTKEKAYIASMKSDLRNLVTAEEAYFADNNKYTTTKASLSYSESSGVTVVVNAATTVGWDAKADHGGTGQSCTIWIGSPAKTGNEGEPVCA